MNQQKDEKHFEMTEPRRHPTRACYAFWLTSEKQRLFDYTADLLCVQSIEPKTDDSNKQRALVLLKTEFDADEAWHYIRQELEREANYVELDDIWNDALWL